MSQPSKLASGVQFPGEALRAASIMVMQLALTQRNGVRSPGGARGSEQNFVQIHRYDLKTMGYADPEARKRYAQSHYAANRQLYIDRAKASRIRVRDENKRLLVQFLLEHPCSDCGEADPVVLQFDHIASDKTANIGRMLSAGLCWRTIKAEMDKCEVVCANCHFRRTAKRHGGWLKATFSPAGVA